MCSEPVTLGGGLTMVQGVRVRPLGAEQAVRFPMRVPALLDSGGIEGLGKVAHRRRLTPGPLGINRHGAGANVPKVRNATPAGARGTRQ